MRGTLKVPIVVDSTGGITPAYAGNTRIGKGRNVGTVLYMDSEGLLHLLQS